MYDGLLSAFAQGSQLQENVINTRNPRLAGTGIRNGSQNPPVYSIYHTQCRVSAPDALCFLVRTFFPPSRWCARFKRSPPVGGCRLLSAPELFLQRWASAAACFAVLLPLRTRPTSRTPWRFPLCEGGHHRCRCFVVGGRHAQPLNHHWRRRRVA